MPKDNSVHIIKDSLDIRIKSHDSSTYPYSASIDLPCHSFGPTRLDAVIRMISKAKADLSVIEDEAMRQLETKQKGP